MPPLPTNAPTTGNAAVIYWSLAGAAIVIFVLVGAFKYWMPSGKDRLGYRASNEQKAIALLETQIKDLKREIHDLREEVRQMRLDEEAEREYRHALANQVQGLLTHGEMMYSLLTEILADWAEMPPHFRFRLQALTKPNEILNRFPLPSRGARRDS